MKTKAASAVIYGILFLGATVGRAAGTDGEKQLLDLNDCVKNALAVAPELGESQADIDLAASKLVEAKAHRYPQLDFLGLIGPVPQARGNQVASPDSINQTSRLTWFTRGDATLVQPLYTFGKISESMKAASHGIEVDRAKKEQRRNEVALQVKEYYYGLLLARELKEVVLEVQEDLDKARKKAREYLDKGSPNVDDLDIYKLDAFSGEVAKYLEEAKKGETLALAALRSRIGLSPDAPFDIATARLAPDETTAAALPAYLAASQSQRPEYRQVKEGLLARQALVEAAKAAYWPDLFLGGYLSGAYAEKRDRVSNPWVPDEFNHLWGGVALGLKWKLDFGITGAKVAAEQAQYDRLMSTKTYAETNIPLQIRKAYLDLQEAEKSIAATKDAYSNAKKWVVAALANFDFGIGPAKEIFDGLENYAKMRSDYFHSIYNQKMSRANLEYAVGASPLEQR
ncbi:TolC family protein [Geobacter pickeringii]|uniref:RND transporter n=1 Tax=Geobacter pickeringii TaxID=345632 RepID=A0A0B5B7R7_9BACT|nr:TolC family protein [Geobacter pickeringii]AJE02573.1 RND transporter [Geobacter pickeringii]